VRDPDDAGHVGVVYVQGVVAGEVLRLSMAADDPGVVDQPVDPPLVRLHVGGRPGHGRVVGHVDLDEADPEPIGGGPAALGVPRAHDHGLALLGQAAGGLVAEALVRPGDKGNCAHASSIGRTPRHNQRRLDGRKTRTTLARRPAPIMAT